ncbi:MAG: hypothetical protein JNN00_08825 [Chitinophagaceae bacterium]|nr:hypothetical protein [Chitinophagaceae bacterium]
MKLKYGIASFLLLFLLFFISCHKPRVTACNEPEPDCSHIVCVAHWDYFNFKLTDKVTGKDLLFGTNPRYTTGEVRIFSDAARTSPINFFTDTVNKKLVCMNARGVMYLEIAGNAVYKLTAEFKSAGCCSARIKFLQVDNSIICTCCSDVIAVPVN